MRWWVGGWVGVVRRAGHKHAPRSGSSSYRPTSIVLGVDKPEFFFRPNVLSEKRHSNVTLSLCSREQVIALVFRLLTSSAPNVTTVAVFIFFAMCTTRSIC